MPPETTEPTAETSAPTGATRENHDLRVLSLLTNESHFHRAETAALAERGVHRDVVTVPGHWSGDGRSVADYLRFVPQVVGRARSAATDYDLVHANYGLSGPAAIAQQQLPTLDLLPGIGPALPTVLSLWGSDLLGDHGRLSRVAARHCDEVVVMSAEMAGTLDRPVHVVPHGVDAERFSPMPKRDAREQVGWTDAARHVLFPYDPGRGVKDFPRAGRVVDAARKQLDDATGPVELHVLGGVAPAEVPAYVNAADAVLVTSKREGSPNVVKEALACNRPVVSTDVGDVADRLDGVSPSLVADEDERLATGLADILAAPRLSNGRDAIAALRVEHTAARLHGVYERALDRS